MNELGSAGATDSPAQEQQTHSPRDNPAAFLPFPGTEFVAVTLLSPDAEAPPGWTLAYRDSRGSQWWRFVTSEVWSLIKRDNP